MKSRFSLSSLLMAGMVAVALCFASCAKEKGYKNIIPTDAPIVMEIDMQALTLKSNILSYKDTLASLIESFDENNAAVLQIADALRKADDGGLDCHVPVYVFMTPDCDALFALAAVRSKEELVRNAQAVGELKVVEEEGSDVAWVMMDGKTLGAITNTAVLIGTMPEKKEVEDLLKAKGDFFGTKIGRYMTNHAGDVTAMLNCQAVSEELLEELISRLFRKSNVPMQFNDGVWEKIRQMQLVVNLQFTKGQIALNICSAVKAENPDFYKPISADAFDQIPAEDLLGMLAIGVDGEAFAAALDKEMTASGTAMTNEMRMGLTMVSGFLKAMDGTAIAAMYWDIWQKNPDFICCLPMPLQRAQPIALLIQQVAEMDLFTTGDDKNSAISNMRSYNYGHVREACTLAERAGSSYVYGFLDIRQLFDKIYATKIASGGWMNETALDRQTYDFIKMFRFLEIKMDRLEEASIILTLENDERNSLDVLIKSSFELALAYVQDRQLKNEVRYNSLMEDDDPFIFDESEFDFDDSEFIDLEEVEW